MACTFQAMLSGKFAPLTGLSDEDMDIDTMIATYNTAVTDAASEIHGKERRRKKPWVTKDVLDLCDDRRDLKKRYEAEGEKEYREANIINLFGKRHKIFKIDRISKTIGMTIKT